MPVNSKQNEPWLSSFAGVGTIAGAGVGYRAANKHYHSLAAKTVKMFNGELNRPDRFLRRHDTLLTDAANSTKGFFGKINRAIGNKGAELSWAEKIEQGASEVVSAYRNRAQNALKNSPLTGEALENSVQEFCNGKFTKDIAKSIKNVSKNKTVAIVLGAAVAGTLLFNGLARAFKPEKQVEKQFRQGARSVKESKKIKN